MKKFLFTVVLAILVSFSGKSQVNESTIGFRFPYGLYFGPEVSYHLGISERNRFEFDAGFLYSGGLWTGAVGQHYRLALSVIFHWDINLFDSFNLFVGPGIMTGPFIDPNNSSNNFFFLAAGGQIGVEYDFSRRFGVPFVAAIDHRPMIDIIRPYTLNYDGHIAISARYILK